MSLYDEVIAGIDAHERGYVWGKQAHKFYSWWLDQGNGEGTSFKEDVNTLTTMTEEDLRALIFTYYLEDS